jgi:hypothetical protein
MKRFHEKDRGLTSSDDIIISVACRGTKVTSSKFSHAAFKKSGVQVAHLDVMIFGAAHV